MRPLLDLEGLKRWVPGRTERLRGAGAGGDRAVASTTTAESAVTPTIDLDGLGLDAGGHLLVARALAPLSPGQRLTVRGPPSGPAPCSCAPGAAPRATGSSSPTTERPWSRAPRRSTGGVVPSARARPDRVAAHADRSWGLAARGALVEPGGPPLAVEWVDRDLVWADVAPRLYAQAAAHQWDPATAVDWQAPLDGTRRDRGRRGPGDDLPGRERAGRAHDPGAAAGPAPSALTAR